MRADIAPATLSSLPPAVSLSRGRLEVNFRTVEELAEAMYAIARILEAEEEEFAGRFEPQGPAEAPESYEIEKMFEGLSSINRIR